jgi:hypothetical protein
MNSSDELMFSMNLFINFIVSFFFFFLNLLGEK